MGGLQAGLSLPVTLAPLKRRSIWHLASRRFIVFLAIASLLLLFFITYIRPISSSVEFKEPEKQEQKTAAPSPTLGSHGLTELGLEADQSYHLGTIDNERYTRELENFIVSAFPPQSKNEALQKLKLYLSPDQGQKAKVYPPIPKKIWQTAEVDNPNLYADWQSQSGYEYVFMNDEQADKWVKAKFGGTKIGWTWDNLHVGILKSDMLRYLVILFEGGVYTDTDTRLLKPIGHWGRGWMDYAGTTGIGPPGVIVGIEADVGGREDWHSWWARPVQICQWTLAAAPYHPILVDAVRRIYERTLIVSRSKDKNEVLGSKGSKGSNGSEGKEPGMGSFVQAILEWTGPGVFTDSVVRYLGARYGVMWPTLKDLRKPLRFHETVILPVTAFSPGVKLFGAGEVNDEEAMVLHWFYGSWKHRVPS